MRRSRCAAAIRPGGDWAGLYAGFCTSREVTVISLECALPHTSSGLPERETSSLVAFCLTLLQARFTEPAESPRPLVGSYPTVSPLPLARRSVFCGTISRVAPGGCYPPPCSVEPGRSSALSRRDRPADPIIASRVPAEGLTWHYRFARLASERSSLEHPSLRSRGHRRASCPDVAPIQSGRCWRQAALWPPWQESACLGA